MIINRKLVLPYPAKVALLACVSIAVGWIGLRFAFDRGNVTLVWPHAGVVLAVLLLFGRDLWIGVWLGVFVLNLGIGMPPEVAFGVACGNALAAYLGAAMLQGAGFNPALRRVSDVLTFVGLGVVGTAVINASISVCWLAITGIVPSTDVLWVWFTWWLGDASGILVVASALLVWVSKPLPRPGRPQIVEISVIVLLVAVITTLIFNRGAESTNAYALAYLIFPLVIWAALRFAQHVIVSLNVLVAVIVVLETFQDFQNMGDDLFWVNLMFLWLYMTAMSVTSLLLAATLSERQAIQEQMGSLEERFAKAFYAAPLAISISDRQSGRFVDVNQEFCTFSGYSREEVIGKTALELKLWVNNAEWDELISNLERPVRVAQMETRMRTKSGEIHTGLSALEALTLNGRPHLLGMLQDITARVQAEAALRDSEMRYRQLFGGIEDPILVHDLEGVILDVNVAACRSFGYRRDELVGKHVVEIDSPDFAAGFHARMQQQLDQGHLHQIEGEIIAKDGHLVRIEINSNLIIYEGALAVLWVGRDITERKLAEQKLRESEARYRAVVEDQTEFIARVALDWQIKFVNEAYCRYYGKPREALIDSYFKPRVHDDDFQLVRAALKSLSPENPTVSYEHRVILDDGTVRWQQWNNRAILNDDQQVIEYQFVGKDITELKQAEQARLIAAVEREKVGILADFIAAASHDFRTPLSVINTSAYLLHRADDTGQHERHFLKIQEQTSYLEQLVEGLLTMSKLDRGDSFHFKPIRINSLIQQIETRKRALFEQKQLALTLDLARDLPLIDADEDWLYECLVRLVDNAIQYTPSGGSIAIFSRLCPDCVTIEVRDNGVGISPEDLPHIFERLYRAETHRPVGGQGLGLAIVKKVVEAHHGWITVESEPEKGSVFRVRLPLTQSGMNEETSLFR